MDTTKRKIGELILEAFGEEGVSVVEAAYQILDARCQDRRGTRVTLELDPRLQVPPGRR